LTEYRPEVLYSDLKGPMVTSDNNFSLKFGIFETNTAIPLFKVNIKSNIVAFTEAFMYVVSGIMPCTIQLLVDIFD
jgi:hypothetical protein